MKWIGVHLEEGDTSVQEVNTHVGNKQANTMFPGEHSVREWCWEKRREVHSFLASKRSASLQGLSVPNSALRNGRGSEARR